MAEKKKSAKKASIDFAKVDSIVKRMKKKQAKMGLRPEEEVSEARLKELRGIISGAPARIQLQTAEDLKKSNNVFLRIIGHIYGAFGFVFRFMEKGFQHLTLVKKLDYFLYSANMHYSGAQWLAIATVFSAIVAVAAFVLSASYFILVLGLPSNEVLLYSFMLGLAAFLLATVFSLLFPKLRADSRANAINVELPFALRHMATELRAGIGLYKTLQTIAVNTTSGSYPSFSALGINPGRRRQMSFSAPTRSLMRHPPWGRTTRASTAAAGAHCTPG